MSAYKKLKHKFVFVGRSADGAIKTWREDELTSDEVFEAWEAFKRHNTNPIHLCLRPWTPRAPRRDENGKTFEDRVNEKRTKALKKSLDRKRGLTQ